ncbi:MAG: stage II sporulation protein P [Acutalibacteraceae bacterium]|nr:stage II sporulation protein P [Acutalibacteraceae bacterium]
MRKNSGVLRLVCVFAVCIALISYNTYSFCFKGRAEADIITKIPADTALLPTDEETKTDETVSEETPLKEITEESTPASTDGNVKGKVISRYISPYNAGLSYDGVYMKNSTDLDVNIKELLTSPLTFKIEKSDSPQVLIVHTHTTETYMTEDADCYTDAFSSRTRDSNKNMVSVGKIVAEKLNNAGIKTLHDTTEHDYPNYTGSYSRAATTINGYLKKYPSINVVLDLHRDAVSSGESDKVKLVTEIEGKKAAQVMLVMGSQSGSVTNFPNWKENLKLAVRLQQKIEEKYPTLARPLSLMPKNYNESLTKGSLLIEFGTDVNTLEEAHYSAELVGNALAELLSGIT